MKTDHDFLEGMYEKAKAFESDETINEGLTHEIEKSFFRKYAGVAIAALFAIAIIPSLYFGLNKNYSMVEPVQLSKQIAAPQAAAALSVESPIQMLAEQSDLIVIAKVKNIEISVYETDEIDNNNMTTTVNFKIKELLSGVSQSKSIELIVNGGYDQKTSNYIPYEAFFTKGETKLLFLTRLNEDKYTLTNSAFGVYTKVNDQVDDGNFSDKFGNTTTKQEIIKILP